MSVTAMYGSQYVAAENANTIFLVQLSNSFCKQPTKHRGQLMDIIK